MEAKSSFYKTKFTLERFFAILKTIVKLLDVCCLISLYLIMFFFPSAFFMRILDLIWLVGVLGQGNYYSYIEVLAIVSESNPYILVFLAFFCYWGILNFLGLFLKIVKLFIEYSLDLRDFYKFKRGVRSKLKVFYVCSVSLIFLLMFFFPVSPDFFALIKDLIRVIYELTQKNHQNFLWALEGSTILLILPFFFYWGLLMCVYTFLKDTYECVFDLMVYFVPYLKIFFENGIFKFMHDNLE